MVRPVANICARVCVWVCVGVCVCVCACMQVGIEASSVHRVRYRFPTDFRIPMMMITMMTSMICVQSMASSVGWVRDRFPTNFRIPMMLYLKSTQWSAAAMRGSQPVIGSMRMLFPIPLPLPLPEMEFGVSTHSAFILVSQWLPSPLTSICTGVRITTFRSWTRGSGPQSFEVIIGAVAVSVWMTDGSPVRGVTLIIISSMGVVPEMPLVQPSSFVTRTEKPSGPKDQVRDAIAAATRDTGEATTDALHSSRNSKQHQTDRLDLHNSSSYCVSCVPMRNSCSPACLLLLCANLLPPVLSLTCDASRIIHIQPATSYLFYRRLDVAEWSDCPAGVVLVGRHLGERTHN